MKSIRVVSYAINGRGMGHLVRQLAILRWMRRLCGAMGVRFEAWVLTSSEADTLARREGFPALKIPSKSMIRDANVDPARFLAIGRAWVVQTIAALQPDLLVVDTFPAGSFGELVAALELVPTRALVARAVRGEIADDPTWRALLPLYQRVVVPDATGVGPILLREREELLDRASARRALGVPDGARAVFVTLGGGGDPAAATVLPRLVRPLRARGWHVVVGAGPLYQGEEVRGDGITWLDRYAPLELFGGLDAAVSAGGYNAFNELMFAGVPTVFLPQPRIADDQAARVASAVAVGAGRAAASLDAVPDLLDDPGDPAACRSLVPVNGAAAAAAELLGAVLPQADIAAARAAFAPSLLASRAARELDPARLLEVVRAVGGEVPSVWAERRAVGLDLIDRGLLTGELPSKAPPGGAVGDYFARADAAAVPADLAAQLVLGLHRRFPAASGAELLRIVDAVWASLARFEDWPGVVALLRAIPAQRGWPAATFAEDLTAWLARETDLFDAQRSFVRLARGRTPPETLRLLARGERLADVGLFGVDDGVA